MKYLYLLFLAVSFTSLAQQSYNAQNPDQRSIAKILDDWHRAAAEAKFDAYFGAFANDGVFIGTDAAENWNVAQFKAFAKPYFDKGKAWDFKPVERHIYFSEDGKTAWFDELLDTWMKICRGSGVMVKQGDTWKIKQYVLSMTVPNDVVDDAVKIKATLEDAFLEQIKHKK